ncbi:hypothetical protein ACJ6WF_40980 [Streptomyces sp. MMS24-I2-30]|uniref:hypothetical protein n=1 Tax=Streptomyces sp. MMS24-I2-30 TaxID=3351564 RepID=UPI003896BD49
MQGADVRLRDRLVGRRDQLRGAPAQLRADGRSVGDDVQAAGVRVERHRLDAAGELWHGCVEDGVELGEEVAAGGRGDHAALGHHQADRRAEPERLAPVAPYDRGGAPLRLLGGGAVLLRRFPGRDQGLPREVDAAQLGHAITAPAVRGASSRSCSSRAASR